MLIEIMGSTVVNGATGHALDLTVLGLNSGTSMVSCSDLVIMDKKMKLTVTEGWDRLCSLPLPPGDS